MYYVVSNLVLKTQSSQKLAAKGLGIVRVGQHTIELIIKMSATTHIESTVCWQQQHSYAQIAHRE